MYYFMVEIESADGNTIKLGGPNDTGKLSDDVTDVEVMLDTHDNAVSQKVNAMLARLTIKGKISKEDNAELMKVFAWAKDFDDDTTYRKVKITVYQDAKAKIFRTYEFEQMFVRDYEEKYLYEEGKQGNNEEILKFTLFLTQQKNNLDQIKTY